MLLIELILIVMYDVFRDLELILEQVCMHMNVQCVCVCECPCVYMV